mmetsp:Transcript_6957/g.11463  ORF Transcript_6957/g.11463 Transcript_6957/m.11463 type:complete len:197 (-) Transcript_6957:397-987(-)
MAHVRRGRKRIRAHANPFSEADVAVPLQPGDIDWKTHFDRKVPCRPNICDVGCGFGGLILALSSILPEDLVVGLEIRPQAVAIVEERLRKAREDGKASNVCVLRCNVMKHFAHYFSKGQLDKIFFTFADPHFKKSNYRRRIINEVGIFTLLQQLTDYVTQSLSFLLLSSSVVFGLLCICIESGRNLLHGDRCRRFI